MITFWIIAIAMVAVALVFLLRPLRFDLSLADADRTAQNIAITKERLNELKLEFEQSTISEEEYEQTREELEQALLNDVEQPSSENAMQSNSESYNRLTRIGLIFSVPVFAISLYAYLGQPELIDGAIKQAAAPSEVAGHATSKGPGKLGTLEEMIEKLASRLKEQPNNAEGWFMLGRSYMSLKRYKEAVNALEKTNQLIPNNPVVMLRYADALTMLKGGQISGKPFELIKKAVELKPDDPTGLWLLGMGYEEQGNYSKAISYWNLLLGVLTDEKSKNEVNSLISRAKIKAGIDVAENTLEDSSVKKSVPEKYITSTIKVNVSLDKNLLRNVSANDTIFIFARALKGPPMPLAVVRKQVKDLPLSVELDDSMAMMPTMKLSNFEKVQVVARISKSGSAKAQRGDIQSEVEVASAGQKEKVELIINQLLP